MFIFFSSKTFFGNSNHLKERIRLLGVENLIAVHHCDKVLCIAEVDDVVRVARQHVNALDVVTSHFKLYYFVGAEFAFLNQSVTADHDEELPLGVVPVLAFGDAGLADVDAHRPFSIKMETIPPCSS